MEAGVKQGTEAKITQEMVDELLAVKGKEYPTKGQWNTEATRDTIRHWVEGIGDINPLYVDEAYAKKTRFGGITAPFSFLLSCEGRSGRVGMPGIHALHAGVRFINHKPICAGDTIIASGGLHDLVEKKTSSFAKRTFVQTWFKHYRNQKGEIVSTLYDFAVRSERDTASEKGKYHGVTKHKWTEAELQDIWKGIEAEEVRGAKPRYWEDVNVGDDLRPVVKGPLTMSDVVAFKMGWGSQLVHHIRANEVRYWMMKRHPGIPIRNRLNVPDCPEAVHMDDDFAVRIGFPGWYDYGPQRVSWVANLMTNWVGDDGWVKEFYAEVRRPNIEGDVQWCKGKVTRKWVEGNEHLVACDIWAENQRGEITAPGNSTVILPSRG